MEKTEKQPISLQPFLPQTPYPLYTLPSLFISHGAPTIAIENNRTTQALNKFGQNLPKPRLIIIISAHWQSQHLEINGNAAPATWHDFSGFQKALYTIDYPVNQAIAFDRIIDCI